MPTLLTCPFAVRIAARLDNPGGVADPALGEHVRSCLDCRRRILDVLRSQPGGDLGDWLASSGEELSGFVAEAVVLGTTASLRLGPYLLVDRLGAGGMGEVFRAWHTLLRRFDAVKRIRPEFADGETAVRRFLREAEAAARLRHPNVVAVYSADRAESGYFLAMEYVPGDDLGRLARSVGRFPIGVACEYAIQAARGLHHAYEQGLVHRDIKPGNLLVTADRRTVKVADFGLARAVRTGPVPGDELTGQGGLLGTYDYMAPEQAEDARAADTRSDLYSLGCTLHFLLAGSVPFPGGSFIDKLSRHASSPPPDVRSSRPEVPVELAAVVRRLLAKKPDERYRTPHELARALARFATVPSALELSTVSKSATETATVSWTPGAESTVDPSPRTTGTTTSAPSRPPRSWKKVLGRSALALLALYVVTMTFYFAFIALFGKNANSTFSQIGTPNNPQKPIVVLPELNPSTLPDPVAPRAGNAGPWKHAKPFRSPRTDKVRTLGFTSAGQLFAGYEGSRADGSDSGWTAVWAGAGGDPLRSGRQAENRDYEYPIGVDPNGKFYVTDRLRVVDFITGEPTGTFAGDIWKDGKTRVESLESFAFTPLGSYAVGGATPTSGKVRYLLEWELPSRKIRSPCEVVTASDIKAVATNANGTRFAAGTKEGTIQVADVTGSKRLWKTTSGSPAKPDPVSALAIDSSGNTIYSGHESEGVIRVWDFEADEQTGTWKLGWQIYRMAVSADGRWLAAAGYGLTVWDLTAKPPKQYDLVESGPVELKALAFDSASKRIAAGGYVKPGEDADAVGVVWVWDLKP